MNSHLKGKNEDRIQYDIRYSATEQSRHAYATEALAVDKTVHTQADHYKYAAAEINSNILISKRKGFCAGSKSI